MKKKKNSHSSYFIFNFCLPYFFLFIFSHFILFLQHFFSHFLLYLPFIFSLSLFFFLFLSKFKKKFPDDTCNFLASKNLAYLFTQPLHPLLTSVFPHSCLALKQNTDSSLGLRSQVSNIKLTFYIVELESLFSNAITTIPLLNIVKNKILMES